MGIPLAPLRFAKGGFPSQASPAISLRSLASPLTLKRRGRVRGCDRVQGRLSGDPEQIRTADLLLDREAC